MTLADRHDLPVKPRDPTLEEIAAGYGLSADPVARDALIATLGESGALTAAQYRTAARAGLVPEAPSFA